ncbi:sigma-70 family RNA polymerase sigma factor [Streptomyces sp. NPDC007346]|uniref:sigma-70 family RNA polymerase sigma factor n=1 Tax=Streptomyces sp. NPDC007346 TaxID=3154682 RepID=UPI00345452FE
MEALHQKTIDCHGSCSSTGARRGTRFIPRSETFRPVGLFQHWRRASRADHLDAYAKTVLVRTYVAEHRRSVRDLLAHRSNVPRPQTDPSPHADLRITLLNLLGELPPRARAMVVLRYWDDLSVETVASLLRCSESTVKSQCSRSLVRLRARMGDVRLYSTGS